MPIYLISDLSINSLNFSFNYFHNDKISLVFFFLSFKIASSNKGFHVYCLFSPKMFIFSFTFRIPRFLRRLRIPGCRGPRGDGEARFPCPPWLPGDTGGCRCTAAPSGPSRLSPFASRRRSRRCPRCRTSGSVAARKPSTLKSMIFGR